MLRQLVLVIAAMIVAPPAFAQQGSNAAQDKPKADWIADAKLAPAGRADDQALQLEKTAVADWGACYYDRYWSLVGWVRHELMARK